MKIGKHIELWNCTGSDTGRWPWRLWIELRVGRWWYVLFWLKQSVPCLWRSDDSDAPSPFGQNVGCWYLGRRAWESSFVNHKHQQKDHT